jgi:predicted dehydrogenase
MKAQFNRRQFVRRAALAGLATAATSSASAALFKRKTKPEALPANDRLNIGVIGTANRAMANIQGVAHENIVALCDVDENLMAAAAQKFPKAAKYTDWRDLLDHRGLDAVVVSTPDHTHAVATVAALKSGLHVYCEKPLTLTVSEARIVRETARGRGLATQMGNQIHASTNYRRVVELIQSDAIGPVTEVHVWVGATYKPYERPTEIVPVPAHLHYDLWLGPAQYRPYHPEYLPFKWRNWWAFGGGTLADFGCHYMDLPFWALGLQAPLTVEAEGPLPHKEGPPENQMVRYEFGARGPQPPVKLTWYQGQLRPPHFAQGLLPKWGNGVLFIGARGMLIADYGKYQLLPEASFAGFQPPAPFIPDSIGHHKEWTEACKHGVGTTSNFEYAGLLTEAVLLGNVSHRLGGKKLMWDPLNLRAANSIEADEFIQHHYRRGWRL